MVMMKLSLSEYSTRATYFDINFLQGGSKRAYCWLFWYRQSSSHCWCWLRNSRRAERRWWEWGTCSKSTHWVLPAFKIQLSLIFNLLPIAMVKTWNFIVFPSPFGSPEWVSIDQISFCCLRSCRQCPVPLYSADGSIVMSRPCHQHSG